MSTKATINAEFGQDAKTSQGIEVIKMMGSLLGGTKYIDTFESQKKKIPFILGRVLDFTPEVTELRMYKDGELDSEEGHQLNNLIMNIKNKLDEPAIKTITSFMNMGIPMIPFPKVEDCLGLTPSDSHMEIKDGQAIMAFDYSVKKSRQKCLFNMKDVLASKEKWLAEQEEKKMKKKGQKFDISGLTKHIEMGIKGAEQLGLDVDLVKRASEGGFDGIKDVLKDVDINQATHQVNAVFQENKHILEKGAKDFLNLFN